MAPPERLKCLRCGAEVSGPFQPDGDATRLFFGLQKRAGAAGVSGQVWFCEPCLVTLFTNLVKMVDGDIQ